VSQSSPRTLDTHVIHALAHGGGDRERFMSLANHTRTCKPLLEVSTGEAMYALNHLLHRPRDLNRSWRRHALRRH
jgi:hypothetical protein